MVTVREEVLWQPCKRRVNGDRARERRVNGDRARGGSMATVREEDQW